MKLFYIVLVTLSLSRYCHAKKKNCDCEIGPRGATGPPGTAGIEGEPGVQGDKGEKGDQGSSGAKGGVGDMGVRGIPGKNNKGIRGPTGVHGICVNCKTDYAHRKRSNEPDEMYMVTRKHEVIPVHRIPASKDLQEFIEHLKSSSDKINDF